MSILNCIPELWNVALMEEMEKAQVFGKVCRCEIDAPITKMGQSVHISGIGDINIGTYDGTDITMQDLSDAGVTMVIDKADYFDFWVNDVDALQANANLMAAATKKAAYKMKDKADVAIYTAMAAGAGLTSPVTVATTLLVISGIAEADLQLKEKDIPKEERYIIIPNWAGTKLLLAGIVHAQDLKGNINGFVTGVLGIDIYESSNIAATVALAGSYGAVAFAEQIVSTEAFKPEKRFGDALKGLHVYGIKVVKPNELAISTWAEAAETVI